MNKKKRLVILSLLTISLICILILWWIYRAPIFFPESPFGVEFVNWKVSMTLGYLITLLAVLLGYLISKGMPKEWKFKMWGIIILLPISLPLAHSLAWTYVIIESDGWAIVVIYVVFPLILFISLITFFIGVLYKPINNLLFKGRFK